MRTASRGRPLTPWSAHVARRVSTGPIEYSRLIGETAAIVPPGRAYRHYVAYRRSLAIRSGTEYTEPVSEHDKDSAIRSGATTIAKQCVNAFVQRGQVVLYFEDGVRMARST